MEKKRYVRAEQKLINIAADSVLFTNSSGFSSGCTGNCPSNCGGYSDCPSNCDGYSGCPSHCDGDSGGGGNYSILFGMGSAWFSLQYGGGGSGSTC
ncbi:MAG: hypothetical protein IKI64_08940 [Clostridia bacterium]|nr:hypothetical protein [Clostridia bacterium]